MLPKKGDLIKMISMDDPNPILPGDQGRVISIEDFRNGEYQIKVDWESGRGLHLIYPKDRFEIISS